MEVQKVKGNVSMKVCGDEVGNSNRVNRGGSWNNDARNCTASNRDNNNPDNRNNNLGFRLAASQHCDLPVHNPRRIPARYSRQKMLARLLLVGYSKAGACDG